MNDRGAKEEALRFLRITGQWRGWCISSISPVAQWPGLFQNSKLNYMSQTQAQKDKIKAYLQKGKGLTALEAVRQFGCLRLAARIKNLSDEGVQIKRQWIKTKNGKHIVRYSI